MAYVFQLLVPRCNRSTLHRFPRGVDAKGTIDESPETRTFENVSTAIHLSNQASGSDLRGTDTRAHAQTAEVAR
jgi:hypothetical protein